MGDEGSIHGGGSCGGVHDGPLGRVHWQTLSTLDLTFHFTVNLYLFQHLQEIKKILYPDLIKGKGSRRACRTTLRTKGSKIFNCSKT